MGKSFREWMEPKTKVYEDEKAIEVSYSDPSVRGYIHAERDPDNPSVYRVNRVTVNPQGKGYGKKLYQIALDLVTKRGGVLAPAKKQTSDSAMNVWRSLYGNSNVDKTAFATKDWGFGSRHEQMLRKYPGLRFADPKTHPPKEDADWWALNSGYRSSGTQKKPTQTQSQDELSLEDI